MKKIKLTFLALAPLALYAQSGNFTLQGKVGNLNAPAKAYFIHITNEVSVDSTVLKDGAFEFTGQISDPGRAAIYIDHLGVGIKNIKAPDVFEFYIEKGKMNISSPDSISKAKISGSQINDELVNYKKMLTSVDTRIKALMTEARGVSEEKRNSVEFQQEMQNRYTALIDEQKKLNAVYINANPDSYLSLDLLKNSNAAEPDIAYIEPLFNKLSDRIKNSEGGKQISQLIARQKTLAVGSVAPDFTQMDATGKPVRLSDFKGKYVLVDFWASWCKPCRGENPNVVAAFNKYKDKNFTVLGVSLDSDKDAWLKAVEADKLTWTHVSDLQGWSNEVAKLYSISSIPQNVLINPEGVIVNKNLRGEELNKQLSQIFGF